MVVSKKRAAKKRQAPASRAKIRLSPGRLTISYDHPNQILPTLLDVSNHFAEQHIESLRGLTDNVLGTARAQIIVSGCAGSTCWSCTLSDVQAPPNLFQTCVFNHVKSAGFAIELNQIPASSETQLADVVIAIQSAPNGGR